MNRVVTSRLRWCAASTFAFSYSTLPAYHSTLAIPLGHFLEVLIWQHYLRSYSLQFWNDIVVLQSIQKVSIYLSTCTVRYLVLLSAATSYFYYGEFIAEKQFYNLVRQTRLSNVYRNTFCFTFHSIRVKHYLHSSALVFVCGNSTLWGFHLHVCQQDLLDTLLSHLSALLSSSDSVQQLTFTSLVSRIHVSQQVPQITSEA